MSGPARAPVVMDTPRMGDLACLPLFFAMKGRRAIIAGGNTAAAWKAELLAAAGASVEVYASNPCQEMLSLESDASERKVRIVPRAWAP